MAKAIMEQLEPSLPFEKRVIYLKEKEPVRIGRPKSNESENKTNALFNSKVVSGIHAYLTYTCGQFNLEDRSKNGTFINGYKLTPGKHYSLTSGDIIELGTEAFFNEDTGVGIIIFIKLFCHKDEDLQIQSAVQKQYPHSIQLYCSPPLFEFNLETLQICTLERFSVFQIISNIGHCDVRRNAWIQEVANKIKCNNLLDFHTMITGVLVSSRVEYTQRQNDHISHYMLLMACCQTSATRKWFIDLESKLLQIRWHFLDKYEKEEFMRLNNLSFKKVSDIKKQEIVEKCNDFISCYQDYYELSFKELTYLVGQREVVIIKGSAFVTFDQLIFPITTYFTNLLNIKLKVAKKNYHKSQYDERIVRLLEEVRRIVEAKNQLYEFGRIEKISYLSIDQVCKESFPLCMERLHNHLCKYSHLRNGGRYQYMLFLKGIGVSLDDAITFWKKHFTKKMSLNHFMKEYLYHIRHCYGKVGKQADYPPLNCNKILDAVPGPMDLHGCPFKTESKSGIMELLKQKNINESDAITVWELVEKGTPQVACNKVFELLHGYSPSTFISHPNSYYIESKKTLQTKKRGCKKMLHSKTPSFEQSNCNCKNTELEW